MLLLSQGLIRRTDSASGQPWWEWIQGALAPRTSGVDQAEPGTLVSKR